MPATLRALALSGVFVSFILAVWLWNDNRRLRINDSGTVIKEEIEIQSPTEGGT